MSLRAVPKTGRLNVQHGYHCRGGEFSLAVRSRAHFILGERERLPIGLLFTVRLSGTQPASKLAAFLGAGGSYWITW